MQPNPYPSDQPGPARPGRAWASPGGPEPGPGQVWPGRASQALHRPAWVCAGGQLLSALAEGSGKIFVFFVFLFFSKIFLLENDILLLYKFYLDKCDVFFLMMTKFLKRGDLSTVLQFNF